MVDQIEWVVLLECRVSQDIEVRILPELVIYILFSGLRSILFSCIDDNDWDDYGDNGYWDNGPGPMNRMKPGRGGGGYNDDDGYMDGPRHLVHMRGLPYRAIEDDIIMVRFACMCLS